MSTNLSAKTFLLFWTNFFLFLFFTFLKTCVERYMTLSIIRYSLCYFVSTSIPFLVFANILIWGIKKKKNLLKCVTTEFFMDFLPIKKYHEIKKCDAVTAKSSKCLRFFVVVNKAVQSKQCLFMQIIKFIWSCIINVIGNYTIFNSCVHENNYSKSMLSNIRSNSFSLVFSPHIASMQINIE